MSTGNLMAQWNRAWLLYTKQFIATGKEYGRKLTVKIPHDTFVELHFLLMRHRSVNTSVHYDQDGFKQVHINYVIDLVGEVLVEPHKEISLYKDQPLLPATAAAVCSRFHEQLICVFDFGFNINDVCIHEGEGVRDFLSHKGLPRYSDTQLGREAAQKDQLDKMFSERANEADWNF